MTYSGRNMLFSAYHAKASSLAGAAGWVCAMLTCALISGCGNGGSSAATDSSNLQFVADSYGLFLKNNRRLPNDDAEFREFVTQRAAEDPRAKGQTVDQLLTSERDGKPFDLLTLEDAPPAGSPYAAYEQVGVDGRRLIADTAGNIQEVDEATFRTLVPNVP
jgi:hypothetical protein